MYTRRQNYNTGSHWLVGLVLGLVTIGIILSTLFFGILFFAENYGVFIILIGAFGMFKIFRYKASTWKQYLLEFLFILVFNTILVFGIIIVVNYGITFQSFGNLF
jgi:hypothetical protein